MAHLDAGRLAVDLLPSVSCFRPVAFANHVAVGLLSISPFPFSLFPFLLLAMLLQSCCASFTPRSRFQPLAFDVLLLTLLLQICCRSFMLWSVNSGGGYPYPNGKDVASYVSSADFKLMDTNGDGIITQNDDPYAPYYPVRML